MVHKCISVKVVSEILSGGGPDPPPRGSALVVTGFTPPYTICITFASDLSPSKKNLLLARP